MEEKRGGGERRAVGPYGVCGGEMGVEAESVLLEGGAQGGNLGGGEEQAVDADCGTFDKMPYKVLGDGRRFGQSLFHQQDA